MAISIMDFDERLNIIPEKWTNNRLHLFKYMSADVAKIVLKNRTLRWSTPATLNDPFDVQFNLKLYVDLQKLKKLCLQRLWKIYSEDQEIRATKVLGRVLAVLRDKSVNYSKNEFYEDFGPAIDMAYETVVSMLSTVNANLGAGLSDVKILCLSSKPNIVSMWSHYAKGHEGVVLRFRSIPAFDSPFGVAKPINYVDRIPELMNESFMVEYICGTKQLLDEELLDRMVFTKSNEWKNENEWRLHSGAGRNRTAPFEYIPFGKNELDGIIFGLRTSEKDRAEIQNLAKIYPNIQMMVAKRSGDDFGIQVEEIQ